MKQEISEKLSWIKAKKHHEYRRKLEVEEWNRIKEAVTDPSLSYSKRAVKRLQLFLEAEHPVVFENEKITGLRTVIALPDIYTEKEWKDIKDKHYIHEQGRVCNISPSYEMIIKSGLNARKEAAQNKIEEFRKTGNTEAVNFLEDAVSVIEAVSSFAERYAKASEEAGNYEQARILRKVPMQGADTFHEALQSFRLIHFVLWCAGNYHNTIGRFDQYMYSYYKADIESGRLSKKQAFELLEEFFLSFNLDSDLYIGMQQGDNGQSMVLGGSDEEGKDCLNELSRLCLLASLELKLIDPKINLRVNKNTDLEVFELGTQLTKYGLGFPQYSNDDVVIPGLLEKGYELKDAVNYVVAACWEWIIPGVGMDIPNIGALSFARVSNECIKKYLKDSPSFIELKNRFKSMIFEEAVKVTSRFKNIYMEPAPYLSVMMEGCIEAGRDISMGARYNNFGIHGTGISTAVDAMMAVKRLVFEEKSILPEELLEAINDDFSGKENIAYTLRNTAPKFGRDEEATRFAEELLDTFADALEGKINERGGIYRAGTGSAMYYLWHAEKLGATADGRRAKEPLPANFSPSLFIKGAGPLSVTKNLALSALKRVCNGGPLTLELHDTLFRKDESISKVAMLVKSYIKFGGHQLQLNAVNREAMLGAQKRPEEYRNLIVRVWGWSGYFVELDKEYQDQIIARTEFTV